MKLGYFFVLLSATVFTTMALGQTIVLQGRVTTTTGQALPGANVFLKGTYDGTTSDSTGAFRFATTEKDTATLSVSFVGYEPFNRQINLKGTSMSVPIQLVEASNELNTVVITAGNFDASDEKKMTMLKPLDIVTTAGAAADITGVMQLLPGAQRNGEATGLFVRGGDASETKVVMDGLIVQNPFNSQAPNLSSRGRFNPFLFKGTSFSTGGYSAQYGQALSSVLLLNTTDKASTNGFGINLNLVSATLNYDASTEKSSVSVVGYYGNLKPLFALVPQRVDWTKIPEFIGTSIIHRYQLSTHGLLKTYATYSSSRMGILYNNTENYGSKGFGWATIIFS